MPSQPFVATVYGQISFAPQSVLVFKDNILVASGSVYNNNPDRIVLKKIVLTGNPIENKKSKATVSGMFFNKEDVEWFKPIDLWTKYGRHGNIVGM